MLTSTFIHAQGVGPATEKQIWDSGASDWRKFLDMQGEIGLSERQLAILSPVVEESITRFDAGEYSYFAECLPKREHWRAFGELGERAAYLDIETTGTGLHDEITVVGIYNGKTTTSFIKGFNLEDFADELKKYPLIVTYAGSTFDIPHLIHAFPGTKIDQLHIDLCPTLHRLGYKGGLKHIEHVLGLERDDEITGLSGWDAVRLWHEWESGSQESLDTLIEYNSADVENLKTLAEFAYTELRRTCMG
ncbi:MAG: ribonuclease H-like domain-containing protein [Armatimonadota bacterium]